MIFCRKPKATLVIHEGDVVLVEVDRYLTQQQAQGIKDSFAKGGVAALVLDKSLKVVGVKRL